MQFWVRSLQEFNCPQWLSDQPNTSTYVPSTCAHAYTHTCIVWLDMHACMHSYTFFSPDFMSEEFLTDLFVYVR